MKLKFFGIGAGLSGFENGNTSAFFENDGDLILIDCPMTTFYKLQKMDLSKYEDIKVYITHTHGDHIGGLGLTVQYCNFVLNKTLVIFAPSKAVMEDIETVLTIEGNDREWYSLINCSEERNRHNYVIDVIQTKHSPQLENKCFGYVFNIEGTLVVYTGDTSTLEPFGKYIVSGSELYIDTSVYYGMIHIKLEEELQNLKNYAKNGVKVNLMHLDDINAAKEIVKDIKNIEVVEIYK